MINRLHCFVLVTIASLLTLEVPAWAGDPTQIGKHVEDIVTPNVKSFWKIALLVGAVVTVFGRVKTSLLVAFWISIVVAGMVIYNPGDFGNTVSDMGKKVL